MHKIINMMKTIKNLSRTKQLIGALIIVAVLLLLNHFLTKKPVDNEIEKTGREVRIASIASLSQNIIPIPLLGTVTSRSEATIRAESSGKLVAVYKKLGDYVPAGGVIAQFENSAEHAAVLQAEGAFDAANAGQNIAQTGSDIAHINSGSADVSLEGAKTQSRNTIFATYSTLDDAIRTKTDPAFRNPQSREAHLIVSVADAKLIIKLEEERVAIETMLRAREARNQTLNAESDLLSELNSIEHDAQIVRDYLDDLSLAYSRSIVDNNASQAAIDGFKANTGHRTHCSRWCTHIDRPEQKRAQWKSRGKSGCSKECHSRKYTECCFWSGADQVSARKS